MTDPTPITMLVATMSGTAEMVAYEALDALKRAGWRPTLLRMEKASPAILAAGGVFLICSSTYGQGDVPDNGQALYLALTEGRPDLSGVRYGVIGLGDMTYHATFCGGPKRLDRLFSDLGARRIGELLCHDRRSAAYPEEAALAWLETWLPLLKDSLAETPMAGAAG
jgi:MioC protein